MIFEVDMPAPSQTRFAPEAFDGQVGKRVPLAGGEATVLKARVWDNGQGATLALEAAESLIDHIGMVAQAYELNVSLVDNDAEPFHVDHLEFAPVPTRPRRTTRAPGHG